MTKMGPDTVAALRVAVDDSATVARYWSHVQRATSTACWYWLGAVSGRGHGRFQLSCAYSELTGKTRRRQTFVVIAHRFGFALQDGVDALLRVPVVAHLCDNPLCQNPRHWRPSTPGLNRREWAARRHEVRGPLADVRGSRGRARAVRDAIRSGMDITTVELAGASELHREQLPLFDELDRDYSTVDTIHAVSRHSVGSASASPASPPDQAELFELDD